MNIIKGIANYKQESQPVYVALGNFDGVHKGHQSLLRAVVTRAAAQNGQSLAFIYEPHPAQVLYPEKAPRLLLTPARKAELIADLGFNTLIYTPFTRDIAGWSPQEFVDKILVKTLQSKEVFVGFNYTFGNKGVGTPEMLQEFGQQRGFKVNVIPPVNYQGQPISSSSVRKALTAGDIGTAFNMLGYYPLLEGVVIKGEQRGTSLGFPTANIGVEAIYNIPSTGVYAARAGLGDQTYHCVVNIGSKPTFYEDYPLSIEAHLIDFSQEIYGQNINLQILARLRDEKRFASQEELVKQINLDRYKALEISQAHGINVPFTSLSAEG